ncbi:hypothetical protein HY02_08080 [Peptococcaceae bacterium SCADC1_2_3]|jgi:alpha-D-ribose 1-methylphosphonate 5-phosphate C-P lyase|nr:hypothetical protein DK28_0203470 [Peptococcaceae bacterium SCADC1_2_3]KFI35853.1 hypothetical protein HY00_00885 [Peptococcaceae bacterium SCADC1_2_3]KFI37324.1 hypothetical protein HY02_08080 [Peptococcaceae bacterium SCADC1_2_3]HBQ28179.1 hypothetical protein [Desulfotomaculum sp.]
MGLEELIEATENLSPEEKIKLVEAISKMLRQNVIKKGADDQLHDFDIDAFWKKITLSELAEEQRVSTVNQLEDLTVDSWPEDESVDEMIEVIYSLRSLNKQQGMC